VQHLGDGVVDGRERPCLVDPWPALLLSGGRREFTEDDEAVLLALGAAAGVAVDNARLYQAARRSQRWMQASAEVTTALLSGAKPGEVLARITSQARDLSDADLAVLALPDDEGRCLTVAYADGDGAQAVRLSVYEDRDRIARDLHDLVIQRLYATGCHCRERRR